MKHHNKYYTTGTRVYRCIKLTQHIPKNIYHFGRYLRICYDEQPKDNHNSTGANTINYPDHTPVPVNQATPQMHKSKIPVPTLQRKDIPDVTPTLQLPDTPNIIPETQ